jgi:hypothetical protein
MNSKIKQRIENLERKQSDQLFLDLSEYLQLIDQISPGWGRKFRFWVLGALKKLKDSDDDGQQKASDSLSPSVFPVELLRLTRRQVTPDTALPMDEFNRRHKAVFQELRQE